jgi:DNA-directed RNA polymerase subunit M/transcription elongation factor TFIIS
MSFKCPKCGEILGESDFDENVGECVECGKEYSIEEIIKEKDGEIAELRAKLLRKKEAAGKDSRRISEQVKEIADLAFLVNEFRMKMQGKESEIIDLQKEIAELKARLKPFLDKERKEEAYQDAIRDYGDLSDSIKESKETERATRG